MKRVMCAMGVATALLMSVAPAMAQTAGGTTPSANAPSVNLVYVGGFAGIGAVQNSSTLTGGEAGVRVYRNLDIVVEGGFVKDAVTRRRIDLTASLATLLQKSTGKTASSDVTAPAKFGLAGVRYVFDLNGDFHAYVLAEAGRASIEYKPTFSVNGTDVTNSLASYGTTLGSDLVSTEAVPAFGGGLGIWYTRGMVYADASVRLLSIRTASQATNVTRAQFGLGVRF